MLAFKKIDCALQFLLILSGLGLAATSEGVLDERLWLAYFLVGGWQLLSVVVHFFYVPPYKTRLRKIYLMILGVVLLGLLVTSPTESLIWALALLLIVSPLMAIYYLITCIRETNQLSLLLGQQAEAGQQATALKPLGEVPTTGAEGQET